VLIARLDGLEATMPVPTHSRYYTREPDRLDEGVLPWVSMVDAVGWGFTRRPALTMTGHGILPRHPTGQQQAVMRAADLGQFTFRPPFDPGTALRDEDERGSLARRYVWGSMHASLEEAAVIQSYPADFPFYGGRSSVFLQIGNAVPPALARAILDHMTREA
jgi:DNA (cytosine-5)-methyltransferase 1